MISEEIERIVVGSRLVVGEHKCTIKYIGEVPEKSGVWYGVEWDDAERGRNDGLHLFKTAVPGAASFIKLNRTSSGALVSSKKKVVTGAAFLQSVKEKYIGEAPATHVQLGNSNGVIVETYGWDKMQRKLAKLDSLRELGLANLNISYGGEIDEIAKALPLVEDIDLSRSLFPSLDSLRFCRSLSKLRILRLNYNRFTSPFQLSGESECFDQITVLTLVSTLMAWSDILLVDKNFPHLEELYIGHNRISRLTQTPSYNSLKVLDLEFNEIDDWNDVDCLGQLPSLTNLNLANNNINVIEYTPSSFQNLSTLNISNNCIGAWLTVDQFNKFPSLCKIRLVGNPIVEPVPIENVHVFLTARLSKAVRVNGSHVSSSDRRDAECYYLSQAHLEKDLPNFKEIHPRYDELCSIHGAPTSKKADRTIADGLLDVVFIDKKNLISEPIQKRLSKKTTVRMVRMVLARALWPTSWQNAARGTLLLVGTDGTMEELTGDDKSLEYLSIASGSTLTIEF